MAARAYQKTLDFESPGDHFDLVHANAHGTVIVWEQRQAGNRWHKIEKDQAAPEVATFLKGLAGGEDTYFTVNEFNGWRITRLLKSLRANYVDMDLGRPADKGDLDAALDVLASSRMPWPSLVVFSGRGMHFYWCTTHTPAPALPVWQAIQKRLIDCLADVGADRLARDCARVLRLVGTVNSKVNEEVRGLVLDAAPWKFHDLANEVLGDRIDGRKKNVVRSLPAAQIRAGNHPKATTFRRWHLVFRDLGVIGSHYGSIPEGSRNEFLFIAGVALSWFAAPESIEDEVADFARLYCSSLDASEAISAASQSVARATKAAAGGKVLFHGEERDPRYFFKRSTLWDRLGDLASPIKDNLRAIIPDELAEEREGERQRCRDRVVEGRYSSHYTGEGVRSINIEKRAQALILKANGVGVREIARHLAVSHPTIRKWLGGN